LGALRSDPKDPPYLGKHLKEAEGIDLKEYFVDRTFVPAKKRGFQVGKTKRGKGTKIMSITNGHGLLIALRTESASPAEVKLVEPTLDERVVKEVPEHLIEDKPYDSEKLNESLMKNYTIEKICLDRLRRRVPTRRTPTTPVCPSMESGTTSVAW